LRSVADRRPEFKDVDQVSRHMFDLSAGELSGGGREPDRELHPEPVRTFWRDLEALWESVRTALNDKVNDVSVLVHR
jgi:hypothetical protein